MTLFPYTTLFRSLRTNPAFVRGKSQFRIESWWASKSGFKEVCIEAVRQAQDDWSKTKHNLNKGVKSWLGEHPTPQVMLKAVEEKMEALNALPPDENTGWQERELNEEHQRILKLEEKHWHQRSWVNWALFGDNNTYFFHATAVTRKRRNTVREIQLENGVWEPDPRKIRGHFANHFRQIYTKVQTQPLTPIYPFEVFQQIAGVPVAAQDRKSTRLNSSHAQ